MNAFQIIGSIDDVFVWQLTDRKQMRLLEQKQLTLNDSQKELDRAKRREMELEEELAEAREKTQL